MSEPGPFSEDLPAAAVPSDDRRGAWTRLVIALVVLIVLVVLAWNHPVGGPGCGFRFATGRPCPGCGMTRAMIFLLHGDPLLSLRSHPLGVPLAAWGLCMVGGAVLGVRRGIDPVWDWHRRRAVRVIWGFILLLTAVWIVRTFVVPEWASDPIRAPFQILPHQAR